jgi:predicted nucleic acid-binding protein
LLTQPQRAGNLLLEAHYRGAFLRRGRNLTLLTIDAEVAERAAELRARYRLCTPDALQLAAVLNAGCQAFLTNDRDLARVTELGVLTLDELEP